jgi:hypothetical protein
MLAIDTEEVAVLEASFHPTNEPPPAFPEEPEYTPPMDTPPSFGLEEYLRLLPSLYSIHGPSRVPSPEPLPIPHVPVHLPQDNPEDPRNLVCGLSSFRKGLPLLLLDWPGSGPTHVRATGRSLTTL